MDLLTIYDLMSPYERLRDVIIKLREEEKRLTKVWKQAHPDDLEIEGWEDDSVE